MPLGERGGSANVPPAGVPTRSSNFSRAATAFRATDVAAVDLYENMHNADHDDIDIDDEGAA